MINIIWRKGGRDGGGRREDKEDRKKAKKGNKSLKQQI